MNLRPDVLKDEACLDGYKYFDAKYENCQEAGRSFDESNSIFINSDVDAFRHAYVSAIFTHEYGEAVAELFGRLNELTSILSPGASPREKNMDLWNNAVGRKYGRSFTNKNALQDALRDALDSGELITNPDDDRVYEGASHFEIDPSKPVIVMAEGKTGRNEVFYDVVKKRALNRPEFVAAIKSRQYSGYTVRTINGIETPVSMSDGKELNNLG